MPDLSIVSKKYQFYYFIEEKYFVPKLKSQTFIRVGTNKTKFREEHFVKLECYELYTVFHVNFKLHS